MLLPFIMKIRILLFFLVVILTISCSDDKKRVLVFSKTSGYRHESIEDGKKALVELGKNNGFEVDTTENNAYFTEDSLKQYRAVVFLSTTQDVLTPVQQADFKRFIEAGGGFVGIHAAADTEYEWPWFGKLVGAYFKSHPQIQEAKMKKVRSFGPNTLPDNWVRTDEWYNYKKIDSSINVIYTLDESSYQGGENGPDHPIAWYHDFQGGRSFYTGLGHTKESYADSLFLQHVLSGINYAIGDNKPDYKKVKSKRMPEDNRFSKTVLDFNLDEPMEMAVLPDRNIIFVERKGAIKYHDQEAGTTEVIATIPVSTKYNKNEKGEVKEAEDGLLGLALDPNFEKNHWIYLYYSPAGDDPKNILTRYVLNGKTLDLTSKKVLLEIPVQRDHCCHTGGSIMFDNKGNLFLSTGDNTNPFESDGYSPSDDRPGRSAFDAQKSSSNTNDLRGKILRIHPEDDGTYTIPEGNLFAKGEPNTRPEIYVMGNRNPFRTSLDPKTGYLYWGEVGPDAGRNDSIRGPRGYDELNQARKAGFFGWPYFVGNNYAYAKYDFETKKTTELWNPTSPTNESRNNTGKKDLPVVSPTFIYYPYEKSEEFPMVGEGGRNAMAGPFYYSENYKGMEGAFPDYFDGKLLMYDWIRNWMFLVTMDENGNIADIEPFMKDTKFNNIIDMTYGPDGKLYMIEYGTQWFKQNIDARLVRIDYNGGNRPPVAMLTADKFNGSTPLKVKFTAKGSNDPDGDKITYTLTAGGKDYESNDGNFSIDFDQPGVYNPVLKVADDKGKVSEAKLQIVAGNESPVIKTEITRGNKMFYFAGSAINYAVNVSDKEDGSTVDGTIPAKDVRVTFDYLKGFDKVAIAQGHQQSPLELPGKSLIDKSDCKSCHMIDARSAGPSYKDVAKKYKGDKEAVDKLAAKIIKGGAGVWGDIEMAAHPQLSVEDTKLMVEYIMSLGEEREIKSLPLSGAVTPSAQEDGAYVLSASYSDKGANNVPSQSSFNSIVLRNPMLKPDQATDLNTVRVLWYEGNPSFENVEHGSYAAFKDIDLTSVRSIVVMGFLMKPQPGGTIELRNGKADGELIGTAKVSKEGINATAVKLNGKLEGVQTLYVVFKNAEAGDADLFYFVGLKLENK